MSRPDCVPRYCSACGSALEERVVPPDHVARMVCGNCAAVAYRNPGVLVTTIIEAQGKVLLCRRADPPRAGFWTLPGGYMECGESLEEAAVRETAEETGIAIDVADLRFYGISSVVDISQVYVGFLVRLRAEAAPVCGPECLEVAFFAEDEVPWRELAFADLERYLRSFFDENRTGEDNIHVGHLNAERGLRDVFSIARSTRSVLQRDPGCKDQSE